MNGRPRETLGWLKPGEKLAELIPARPVEAAVSYVLTHQDDRRSPMS